MKLFIGIDLGRHGGIAAIDETGTLIEYGMMPYKMDNFDIKQFNIMFRAMKIEHQLLAVCEQIHAMPNQSSVATLTFGKTIGEQLAMLKLLDVPYIEVSPTEWKKNVLKGMPWKADTVRFKAPKGASKEEIDQLKKQHKKEHGSSNNRIKKEAKMVSAKFAMRMFPEANIMNGKNPHDGIADAICMAYYGYLLDKGSLISK